MKSLLSHVAIGLCGLSLIGGCMDGPFYAIKRINPYFHSKWQEDRQHGPTFGDRIDELKLLEKQLPEMSADEQNRWAGLLESLVRNDPSPELRSRAVLAIANVQTAASERALNTASADEVEKVRLAACKAWPQYGGQPAQDMLLSLATTDESNSVRQAAIESLAAFDDPEVLRAMEDLIEDNSPAIQYQVAQTLEQITGQGHGGDIEAWKEYLSQQLPSAEESTSEVNIALPFNDGNTPPLPF